MTELSNIKNKVDDDQYRVVKKQPKTVVSKEVMPKEVKPTKVGYFGMVKGKGFSMMYILLIKMNAVLRSGIIMLKRRRISNL